MVHELFIFNYMYKYIICILNFFKEYFCEKIFAVNFVWSLENSQIYSFENLLNQTLANSPQINISKLQIDEALADYDYAFSRYFPTIYLGANTGYSKRFDDNYNSV